jgi:hydrogenase maturation protein HypF
MILALTRRFQNKYKIKDIALSGGVFQNRLLFSLAYSKLTKSGFRVHFNRLVPTNDGGLSLGQAYIALKGK